jgi:hypothetical protein
MAPDAHVASGAESPSSCSRMDCTAPSSHALLCLRPHQPAGILDDAALPTSTPPHANSHDDTAHTHTRHHLRQHALVLANIGFVLLCFCNSVEQFPSE